ncbi:MAG: prepilin-type N-terminal cleavage/methylation domain-containing protein [Pseudomonadota bacterium]
MTLSPRVNLGFSLIEAVIALALTALILATLGASLFGLSQGFAKGTARAERDDTMLHVSQSLRRALEQARQRTIQREDEQRPSLLGQPGSLEWLAYMPEASTYRGLHIWRLETLPVDDKSGQKLALTLTPWSASEPAAPYPPHTLVDGVTRLHIQYQNLADGLWSERWEQPRLPLRIRIEISTEAGGDWPPIVVRLTP